MDLGILTTGKERRKTRTGATRTPKMSKSLTLLGSHEEKSLQPVEMESHAPTPPHTDERGTLEKPFVD
jgi:hypothetical protein